MKTVTLIRSHDVFDRKAAIAQRDYDLIGFALVHARIIRALHYQQRCLDLVGGIQRRLPIELGLAVRRGRIAHALIEELAARFPVRRDRLQQSVQVRRPNIVNGGGVKVRREGHAGERRITAVRSAHDADTLWIGDALGDQILDAPGNVVLHLVTPLFVAGVDELLAIAGRAAKIRLEHGVTTIGPELSERVVPPQVARPRPAMGKRNQRKIFR